MKRFIAVLTAVVFGVIIFASPASAHTYYANQGDDWAQATHGYTCPASGECYYLRIAVHDGECDGNRVEVFYHTWDYPEVTQNFADNDGCGGTNSVVSNTFFHGVKSFRVCEATSGGWVCSGLVAPVLHAPV